MSESVRNDKSEEILSSVRKSVTAEPKPTASASKDKLVLTAALRVPNQSQGQPAESSVNANPANSEPVLLLNPSMQTPRAGLEATVAELEAAVTAQFDEWEPDEGETFDDAAWAASAFEHRTDQTASSEPEPAQPDVAPETQVQVTKVDDEPRDEEIQEQDSTPHPDGDVTADDQAAAPESADQPAAPESDPAFVDLSSFYEASDSPSSSRSVFDVSQQVDEQIRSSVVPVVSTPAEGYEVGDSGHTMVVDREMLRQIVSEIVREELTGAMGERITRNVRKLVRREINQVMSSSKMD